MAVAKFEDCSSKWRFPFLTIDLLDQLMSHDGAIKSEKWKGAPNWPC